MSTPHPPRTQHSPFAGRGATPPSGAGGLLDKSTTQIAAMFNDIAPHYDFLNHFLSLNIDKRWRKKVVRLIAQHHPATILDVATGTGDLAIALLRATNAHITGIDISEGMLAIAKRKTVGSGQLAVGSADAAKVGSGQWAVGSAVATKEQCACRLPTANCPLPTANCSLPTAHCSLPTENCPLPTVNWLSASAEALPFADHSFDAVTVAFGVRNFEQLSVGLHEMHRVLKPGGVVAILEFAMPTRFPVKQLYLFYFRHILPAVGRLFSKHRSAYAYLPASVGAFPQRGAFLQLLQQAGFADARCQSLSCGIAMLYTAVQSSKFKV